MLRPAVAALGLAAIAAGPAAALTLSNPDSTSSVRFELFSQDDPHTVSPCADLFVGPRASLTRSRQELPDCGKFETLKARATGYQGTISNRTTCWSPPLAWTNTLTVILAPFSSDCRKQ